MLSFNWKHKYVHVMRMLKEHKCIQIPSLCSNFQACLGLLIRFFLHHYTLLLLEIFLNQFTHIFPWQIYPVGEIVNALHIGTRSWSLLLTYTFAFICDPMMF